MPRRHSTENRSNAGLILAAISVLVLLLIGGGGIAWSLVKDDGSSSASNGTEASSGTDAPSESVASSESVATGDSKEEAAKDLQYAFSQLTPSTVSSFCDAMFGYGAGKEFESKSECLAEFDMDGVTDSMVQPMRDVTVLPSHFQETGDDTLSIRVSDIYPAGNDFGETAKMDSLVWVLKDVSGNGDWRIVGSVEDGVAHGLVPEDAEDYANGGS